MSADDAVACIRCKQTVPRPDSLIFRRARPPATEDDCICIVCNRFNGRLQRLFKETPELKEHWDCQDQAGKADFFAKKHELHGTHLQAAIEEITTHTQSESATNLEEGDIEWLDEDDLKVRYKDKPEQLAAVKRNADTFWHKKREVTLYGDIAYHSKSRVESTTALKRELSIQTNTVRKKANTKVKPDKKITTDGGDAGEAVGLTDKQKATMVALSAACIKQKTVMSQYVAIAEGLNDYIPAFAMKACKLALAELEMLLTEIDLACEEGQCENVQELVKKGKGTKGKMADNLKKITGHVKAACPEIGKKVAIDKETGDVSLQDK